MKASPNWFISTLKLSKVETKVKVSFTKETPGTTLSTIVQEKHAKELAYKSFSHSWKLAT